MKIKLRTRPWSHQAEAIRFALARSGALLAMDMGTGKTLCAIACIGSTHERARILILCPKKVLDVWPMELERHAGFDYELDAAWQSTAKRVDKIRHGYELCPTRLVVAVNYESAISRAMYDALLERHWDLAILDESHRAKGPDTATGKLAARLGRRSSRRICLTGTPTPHSPLDIYQQLQFLDPEVFSCSWPQFRARYARTEPVPERFIGRKLREGEKPPQRIVGVKNLADLEARAARIMYRVTAEQVLDLPETHHVVRPVHLTPETRRAYQLLREETEARLADCDFAERRTNALSRLLALQFCTAGVVKDADGEVREISSEKRDTLAELLEDLPPSEPVVVFARFKAELAQIHVAADRAGRKSLELSGSHNHYLAWREPDAPTVLAVQIQSGGAGIDLTRAAVCVYYSLDWNLANYEQSLARTHRPGQTRRVTYFHLSAVDTIDEEIRAALEQRSDFVEAFLDRIANKESTSC